MKIPCCYRSAVKGKTRSQQQASTWLTKVGITSNLTAYRCADIRGNRTFVSFRLHCHSDPEKNGVFWDVTQCGSCKNRRFGGT
jgi:hypothetical protein